MIMGYPGSTDRFLSSRGIQQALDLYNPSVVNVRDLKLKTMHMDADPAVRIHMLPSMPKRRTTEVLHRPVQGPGGARRLRQEEGPRG